MCPRPQIDHIRRPQLLAAAAEVIVDRGVAATRIADVAAAESLLRAELRAAHEAVEIPTTVAER
jgi:DNA-binding transcriptional regulator YbjK